ncbi:hypothetical protein [Sphingomonas faeni]|uniref:hypothetical protein n=1 Tax=Sphingomonas faeni TaxID=185950 RepID=UPI0033506454
MGAGRNTVRYALATQAYRSGTVRLVDPDLSGYEHIVGTRRGLFAANRAGVKLIAYGLFYGLTIHDDMILAFEACDRVHSLSARGRLVRFRREGAHIAAADVIATGLDNGCHQIDIVDGRICVIDTYNQRILRYPLTGGEGEILHPIPGNFLRDSGTDDGRDDWARGYAHVNSLIACGDAILLMLHNGADKTGRPSEIMRFDRDWRPIAQIPVDGLGCHSFAVLENGAVLTCGSFGGELVSTDGVKVAVCDMMTRGLSVDAETIVVGGTAFAERNVRDEEQGAILFLDRGYRRQAIVAIPAPPMEIRRIDGCDRSLSGHIAASGPVQLVLTNANAPVCAPAINRSSGP